VNGNKNIEMTKKIAVGSEQRHGKINTLDLDRDDRSERGRERRSAKQSQTEDREFSGNC